MKKVIVTTTINPPTKAVKLFQAMKEWDLVVIGDLKTPKDYHLERGLYMDPASPGEIRQGAIRRYWLELYPAAQFRSPHRP